MGERGLTVATVELASAGTGDVSEHAVEHAPPVFVKVEAIEEELAKEAAGLGDPEGEDPIV
jgi:hypothetical protein